MRSAPYKPGKYPGVQHNHRTKRVKIAIWQRSHEILTRLAGRNGGAR